MTNIEGKFSELEKRVQALVSENKGLKERLLDLENELSDVRRDSQEVQNLHGKRMHIREKIERILQSLEGVKGKEDR